MKLGDMTFEDSRNAELLIVPVIERIMSNSETAKLFDDLLGAEEGKSYTDMDVDEKKIFVKKRVGASKELTKRLIHSHYEDTCVIFAALNKINVSDVYKWKRSEANAQIAEMLNDSDLISFFMSPDALAQAVLSVI